MRHGQIDSAQQQIDAAISQYQNSNPEWAARFCIVKARILMLRGAYSESLQILDRPLPPSLSLTDTEVERKMVQALNYDYLQNFSAADRCITDAESLAAAIHSQHLGAVAQTRGMLEVDRSDFTRASAAFRSAAAFGRANNLPRVELDALGNLGYLAMRQEHYDEAVDLFKATLQKSQDLKAADVEAKTLGNLGWNYWVMGDFENSETVLKEALHKASQSGLVEDQTYWLVSLADVETLQNRNTEADATGRQALALAETHDDKKTLTTCLNTLSKIALATGRLDDAEKFNQRAAQIESAGLDHFGIHTSELISGRIAAGRGNYPLALSSLQKVLQDPKAEVQLKWEAHARLAEVFAAQALSAQAQHEFDEAIRTIQAARDSIESNEFRVSFLSSAIEFYDNYVNFLIGRHRTLDALKIADLSRSQSLEQGLTSSPAPSARADRSIDPQSISRRSHSTVLFYWLGLQHSWLWIISPSGLSLVPLPASSELESLVKSYRQSFLDPRDPLEAGNSDGAKLYSLLIAPAEKQIRKNSRVVILPDGSLNSLNFETLIAPPASPQEKPHYWIEDATITTANSLALLSHASNLTSPKDGRLLIVGEALAASPDFPPLPQAGREVSLLENYFTSAQRLELTGANATASHFLASQPEKFSYLHFATHGTASRTRPLESAVILSPEADTYKLYARDVVKHPLNAYLVTISACNGAGTKSYAGEGLVGLSWAFLRAGAHNVIAGLWEVSNASTPQLMDELYKNLHAGDDPASALRKAKLTLVHANSNYRKPFYWAPFLLYSGS